MLNIDLVVMVSDRVVYYHVKWECEEVGGEMGGWGKVRSGVGWMWENGLW